MSSKSSEKNLKLDNEIPGPGTYNVAISTFKVQPSKIIIKRNTINTSERDSFKARNTDFPGPGQYSVKELNYN